MTEIYNIEICVVRGGLCSLHSHSHADTGAEGGQQGHVLARIKNPSGIRDHLVFVTVSILSLRRLLHTASTLCFQTRCVLYLVCCIVIHVRRSRSKLCLPRPASSPVSREKMSSRNATVIILLECFVLWCALVAVGTQGRSLQRIHKHHGSAIVKNLMELEKERELAAERDDDLMDFDELPVHHSNKRHPRHHVSSPQALDSGLEQEMRALGLLENKRPHLRKLPSSHRRFHAIDKRHNGAVSYETMNEMDEAEILRTRARSMHHRSSLDTMKNRRYEVEVREAQNSSLCNYTVVDIPDLSEDRSRTPKKLSNVICNHAGSRCRDTGNYCCIQTYSKIDVSYSSGETEILKIYTGCVCSLRLYSELKPYTPRPPIDD